VLLRRRAAGALLHGRADAAGRSGALGRTVQGGLVRVGAVRLGGAAGRAAVWAGRVRRWCDGVAERRWGVGDGSVRRRECGAKTGQARRRRGRQRLGACGGLG